MRVGKGARLLAGGAGLSLVLASCGGTGEVPQDGTGAGGELTVRPHITEPQSKLIPTMTSETQGSEILAALFDGLTMADEDNKVQNQVAESIEPSNGNKTWTIKIKGDYTFHDGTKVTAKSFADAWNYGANPKNKQDAAGFFAPIKGYAEVTAGKAKKLSGLQVVDDQTLKVELAAPLAEFNAMLMYTAFYPLPEAAFESDGKLKEDFGEKPIGNGVFKMDKPWKKGTEQEVNLSKYDKYAGTPVKVDKVQFKIIEDPQTAINELQAGNVDIIDQVGASQVATAKSFNPEGMVEGPDAGLNYLGFPLWDDKRRKMYGTQQKSDIRKAIGMALDRKTLAEKQAEGTKLPADDFISPLIPGYKEGACGEACVFDAAKAKTAYEAAGGPKSLELTYNADGPGNKEWMEGVQNQLRKNLGIEVKIKPIPKFAEMLDKLDKRKIDAIFRSGWAADYPSTENYLAPIFGKEALKEGGSNYSNYNNPEFDKLVNQGNSAATPEEATQFYRQAADLLVRDLPYLPLFFYKKVGVSSKNIKGFDIDFTNHIIWSKIERAGS